MKENPGGPAEEVSEVVVNQQMTSALKCNDKFPIFLRAVIAPAFFKN